MESQKTCQYMSLMYQVFFLPSGYLEPQTIYKWMEMVISNHFLCKDWVHHPIDSQPFINGWLALGFQVLLLTTCHLNHASKSQKFVAGIGVSVETAAKLFHIVDANQVGGEKKRGVLPPIFSPIFVTW